MCRPPQRLPYPSFTFEQRVADAVGIEHVAITPASGRAHLLLAAAYQRLGRSEEARKAFTKAMEIRPDSTARNISLPARNASDVYLRARQDINRILVQLGLPS
jgi:Flp pilus assembly protein TadD